MLTVDITAAIEYRDVLGWHGVLLRNKLKLEIAHCDVLYAILAGIRGAGVTPVVPVDCGLRGLPHDVSPEVLDLMDEDAKWGWHWLSFRELRDYDWDGCGPLVEMDLATRDREMAGYKEAIRLPYMEQLGWIFGEQNVRLVMGFDSKAKS